MGSINIAEGNKPHAVCIPYPAQGHINPMLKLAKLLHHSGFHITFVNTEYNHKRLLQSRGPESLKGLPDFRFETIPDGLPPTYTTDATQDVPALCESTRKNCLLPFRNLISKLNHSTSPGVPPVTCIVSDGVMSFTLRAAEELGIPEVLFWTTSACGFMGYLQYPCLIQRGLTPLKEIKNEMTNRKWKISLIPSESNSVAEELVKWALISSTTGTCANDESYLTNGYLETPIDWIPGMKDIRLRDLPSFVRTTDPNDIMLNFLVKEGERAHKASAIILNTIDSMESEVLNALNESQSLPPIYTVGSLHLLLRHISQNELKSIGSNLWKEEPECLEWLDSKEPNSVVYVNFGSITVMTPQQLTEFAWGLANSKLPFLWIIRPDLVAGDSAILPPEFVMETKERGMLASWCPQEQVLSHPSIGGFLTHSGWNSTIESVCGGVPMICWPFFAEQQTNCRYAYKHWGIGMEIDSEVKRDEVESLVRELMEGKKGKEMKKKAMEWKKSAEEATAPGGSSYVNMDKLVNQILLPKNVIN